MRHDGTHFRIFSFRRNDASAARIADGISDGYLGNLIRHRVIHVFCGADRSAVRCAVGGRRARRDFAVEKAGDACAQCGNQSVAFRAIFDPHDHGFPPHTSDCGNVRGNCGIHRASGDCIFSVSCTLGGKQFERSQP